MRITSKNLYVDSTNPVGIQDPQGPTVAASAPLRNQLQASSKLELVDTMVDRLAIDGARRNWAFAAAVAHTDPVYESLAWPCTLGSHECTWCLN